MIDEAARREATRRALRTAAVLTLGLVAAGSAGCEQVTSSYCAVLPETRYCCDRAPGRHYDEATGTCVVLPPPFGPLVPPA